MTIYIGDEHIWEDIIEGLTQSGESTLIRVPETDVRFSGIDTVAMCDRYGDQETSPEVVLVIDGVACVASGKGKAARLNLTPEDVRKLFADVDAILADTRKRIRALTQAAVAGDNNE